MKKDIHPDYKLTVFEDTSTGFRFLAGSTIYSDQTTKWEDGKEYQYVTVEISSASHPFYTGKQMLVDTAKRVDKFQARVAKSKEVSKTRKGKKEKKAKAAAKKEAKAESK